MKEDINILNNNPDELADELRRKYNIEIIVAKDDMILDIKYSREK